MGTACDKHQLVISENYPCTLNDGQTAYWRMKTTYFFLCIWSGIFIWLSASPLTLVLTHLFSVWLDSCNFLLTTGCFIITGIGDCQQMTFMWRWRSSVGKGEQMTSGLRKWMWLRIALNCLFIGGDECLFGVCVRACVSTVVKTRCLCIVTIMKLFYLNLLLM